MSIALVSTFLFYGRIRKARREYEKAKDIVSDIIISFNRQFRKHECKINILTNKTEKISPQDGILSNRVKNQEIQLRELVIKVEDFSKIEEKISVKLDEVKRKVEDLFVNQKRVTKRIEEIGHPKFAFPEDKAREVAFPIKTEKVLAPLTETELNVLEMLAQEGGKTAPETKDKIKLTREHTARLMKKLYENGYLERDTRKKPYAYRIKKEMAKILKNPKVKA